MRMSEKGRALLTQWEGGARLRAYRDSGGAWTIGVGHLLKAEELDTGKVRINQSLVSWRGGLAPEQADALLAQDLGEAEAAVNSQVCHDLTQNQFDALVSFTFNVGSAAFRRSTLLRCINTGDMAGVPAQFRLWVYDNHTKVKGLINRREAEVALWEGTANGTGRQSVR